MATMGNPLGGGTDPFGNSSTWARQWAGGGQGGWSGAYSGPANTLPPGYGMTPGMFAGYGGYPAAQPGTRSSSGGMAPYDPVAGTPAWAAPAPASAPGGLVPGGGSGYGATAPAAAPSTNPWVQPAGGTTTAPDIAPPTPGVSSSAAAQPGQPGANLFSGYDDLGQLYWNQNPGQAWAHAWSQLGPNVASPYWNWGMQQQSRYNDQYLAQAALPNNAMMTFTDFINQNAPGFRNTFDNLPASQRGVTNQFMAGGRLG